MYDTHIMRVRHEERNPPSATAVLYLYRGTTHPKKDEIHEDVPLAKYTSPFGILIPEWETPTRFTILDDCMQCFAGRIDLSKFPFEDMVRPWEDMETLYTRVYEHIFSVEQRFFQAGRSYLACPSMSISSSSLEDAFEILDKHGMAHIY